jgi:hypothetical protein
MIPYIRTEEHRKKMSDSCKKRSTPEYLKKQSDSHKGKIFTEEHKQKISKSKKGKSQKGHPLSEEARKKISKSRKGIYCLEKHPNWKGGISFEPYCQKFNNEFKERVRKFFNYTCQLCGKYGKHVHHVNYDKMVCCNNVKPLFIILCRSCHTKTNYHREYWEEIFTNKILLEFDGKCYID